MARRIRGYTSLRRKLRAAPENIVLPVQEELESMANVIGSQVESTVPVGKTTNLLKSFTKKPDSDGLRWKLGWWKRGNLRNWRLGGWRAKFVEWGTKFQSAQPSLGPALRANKREYFRRVGRAMKKAHRHLK